VLVAATVAQHEMEELILATFLSGLLSSATIRAPTSSFTPYAFARVSAAFRHKRNRQCGARASEARTLIGASSAGCERDGRALRASRAAR
jgi:hypothetical protein